MVFLSQPCIRILFLYRTTENGELGDSSMAGSVFITQSTASRLQVGAKIQNLQFYSQLCITLLSYLR